MSDLSGNPRAQAFRFQGGAKGCLLLHGFTGTPFEMRPLGERLAALGYSVEAPQLPGHGTNVEALARTRWEDWFGAALSAWDDLGRRASLRVVAGLSMGALLALHLAHERSKEVLGLAVLAPAIELRNQRYAEHSLWLSRLPWIPRRIAIVPKRGDGEDAPSLYSQRPAYDEIPLRALASMIRLQQRVRAELPRIQAPAVILDGGRDLTVSAGAAAVVESGLASPIKHRLRFSASGHILTEDVDAAAVIAAVERFFADILGS